MTDTNKNLKPFTKEDSARAAECGRKGGIKSGETRRKRREMKEALEILMSMPMKKQKCKNIEKVKSFEELENENVSVQDKMLYVMIMTALAGGRDGVNAFKALNEILDKQNSEITLDTNVLDNLSFDEIRNLANLEIEEDEDNDN